MDTLFVKVSDVITSVQDTAPWDKDSIIATASVKAIDGFSKINKILLASRNKPLTDAKIEDVGREISKVLFYATALAYALNADHEAFEDEALQAHSEMYEDIYVNDAIMCSISGITNIADMVHAIYSEPLEVDPAADPEEGDDGGPDDLGLETDDELMLDLLSVFTSCAILCDRLELDFANLVHNAGLIDKL